MRTNRVSAVVIAVVTIVAVVLPLGAPATARGATVGGMVAVAGEADFGEFSAALAPYGRWLEVAGHGTCWSPDVERNWAPYTEGYWAYTDAGWTWVSREPFGSIVFHYGRWLMTSEGWCWVPGQDWGPAWVSWRTGDKYVGWAPLPPEVPWNAKRGIGSWVDVQSDIGPGYYRFCTVEDFGSPYMREVVFPVARNSGVFVTTRNVTHITVHEESIFCAGPSYVWVNSRCAHPVPTLRLVREPSFNVFVSYGAGLGFAGFIARDCLFLPAPVRVCKPQPHHFSVAPVHVQRQTTRGWSTDRQEVRDVSKYVSQEWDKQKTTLTAKTPTPAGGPAVLNEMRFAPKPVSEQEKRLVLEGEHSKTPLHSTHPQPLAPALQTTPNTAGVQIPQGNAPQTVPHPGPGPAASANPEVSVNAAGAAQQIPPQTLKPNGTGIISNPAPAPIQGAQPNQTPAASVAPITNQTPATPPGSAPAAGSQNSGLLTTTGSIASGSSQLTVVGSQKTSAGSLTATSGSLNAVLLDGSLNSAPPVQSLRSTPALRDPFAGSGFVPPSQPLPRPPASMPTPGAGGASSAGNAAKPMGVSATATSLPPSKPSAPGDGAAVAPAINPSPAPVITSSPAASPAAAPASAAPASAAAKAATPANPGPPRAVLLAPVPEATVVAKPVAPSAPAPSQIPVASPKPVSSSAPVVIKSVGIPTGSNTPPPAPAVNPITGSNRATQAVPAPAPSSRSSRSSPFSVQTGQPSAQIISTTEIGRPAASPVQPIQPVKSTRSTLPVGVASPQGFVSQQGVASPQGFSSQPQGSALPPTTRQENGRTTVTTSPFGSTVTSAPMGSGTSTRQSQFGGQQSVTPPQSNSRQLAPSQPFASPVAAPSAARSGISAPVQSSASFGGARSGGASVTQPASPAPSSSSARPSTPPASTPSSTTPSSSKSKTTDPNAPKP